MCHQITNQNLGRPESFVGGFSIDETTPPGERHVFGPFEIDPGHTVDVVLYWQQWRLRSATLDRVREALLAVARSALDRS